MDYSKIANQLRVKLEEFSGKVSPHFSKPMRRFIADTIYGIHVRKSVQLSEIARGLAEDISMKKTEDRLSRNLEAPGLAEQLTDNLLRLGRSRVRPDSLLILDLSDIHKTHARRMEYLTTIRDGSTGELGNGYWFCSVIASHPGQRRFIPLYANLYSTIAPEFVSENEEILNAVKTVSRHCGEKGIWVIDRGGDRRKLLRPFLVGKRQFVVRLRGDRHLRAHGRTQSAEAWAAQCATSHMEVIRKQEGGDEREYRLGYGSCRVQLPGRPEVLTMVVVRGFGERPMLLLTSLEPDDQEKALWQVIEIYLTRWRIEETIRFLKTTYQLEDVRVLTYQRLRNLWTLLWAAVYFAATYLGESLRLAVLARRLLQAAKRIYGVPEFHYYALADGMSAILNRLGKGRLRKLLDLVKTPAQPQLFGSS